MSGSFGANAVRLARISARLLGWTPETFWSATPADLVTWLTAPGEGATGLTREDIENMLEREGDG